MIWKKNCSKYFSDASKSSDVKEEIIKQVNMLKPFDMEPRKAVPKKPLVWEEEENNCKEEINLTPQDRIGNIDWCKYGCESKLMVAFAKSFCLFLRLNSWCAMGESFSSFSFYGQLPDY